MKSVKHLWASLLIVMAFVIICPSALAATGNSSQVHSENPVDAYPNSTIGVIHFYRNGHHLGTAFKNLRIGKTFAYFPAISLAYQESVLANFGSTPLRFPVSGYQPLEPVPCAMVSHIL